MTPPTSDIPVILLAAGQSRRMGGTDKLLETIDGEPMLRRQARMARAATLGPVLVALPPPPHPRHAALEGLDLQIVPVPDAAEGINASLRAAVAALPKTARAAMVVLADLPDLTTYDLRTVLQDIDLNSEILIWRGATKDGAPGHPVVFSAPLFARIAELSGDSGTKDIMADAADRIKLVPLPGQRARTDLDTPEDWAAWRAGRTGPQASGR